MKARTPHTAKALEMVKQRIPPKAISEATGIPSDQVRNLVTRARARGVIDFYFNADGTVRQNRRVGTEEAAVRNFFQKRKVSMGYVVGAVRHLDRNTLYWLCEQVREDGHRDLASLLRDIIIQAYDDYLFQGLYCRKADAIEAARIGDAGWQGEIRERIEQGQILIKEYDPDTDGVTRVAVLTPQGVVHGEAGDWVVLDAKGDLHVYTPDTFERKYLRIAGGPNGKAT